MYLRDMFDFINTTMMPSQNESILHHSKAACLSEIIASERINLGMIIEQETSMRVKLSRYKSTPWMWPALKFYCWSPSEPSSNVTTREGLP